MPSPWQNFCCQHPSIPERDSGDTAPATITFVDTTKEPANIAEEPAGGFGSLKAVLEITFTVHAKVQLEHTVQSCSTNLLIGNWYPQKQDW